MQNQTIGWKGLWSDSHRRQDPMNRTLFFLLACAAIYAFAAPVAGAQYIFTLIEANNLPASVGRPAINNAGTVAFDGNPGIVIIAPDGGRTTITDRTGPTFNSFFGPSINNAGTAAFVATLDVGGQGIYTGAGGATTLIADGSGPIFNLFAQGAPSINSGGTVAFLASLDAGGKGIFTGAGGATTTIADTNGPIFSEVLGLPSINTAGTVAFFGELDAGGAGIFTSAGGAMTTIAHSSNPIFQSYSSFGSSPSINAAGTVAFSARLAAGGKGIFTGAGGATTPIVDTNGSIFTDFVSNLGINAAGSVAFHARLVPTDEDGDINVEGIFVGDGEANTEVIRTGTALFGSTVEDLLFDSYGFNDAGQVAFRFDLADGRRGIAVANPVPEPSSALLLAASGVTLLHRRRR